MVSKKRKVVYETQIFCWENINRDNLEVTNREIVTLFSRKISQYEMQQKSYRYWAIWGTLNSHSIFYLVMIS